MKFHQIQINIFITDEIHFLHKVFQINSQMIKNVKNKGKDLRDLITFGEHLPYFVILYEQNDYNNDYLQRL